MNRRVSKDNKNIKRIIEILFFIPLIIIGFILYYYIDSEVSTRMDRLKDNILEYMEKQLGRKIKYESISPSIFMYLEIRDLKIFSFVSQEDELFRIKNIKIKYNIFSLLFTRDPLMSISEINISNTLLKFGLKPAQISERTEFQQRFIERLTATKYKFEITGHNVGLILYTDTMLINCTNLFFSVKSTGKSYELNLRKGTTRVTINQEAKEPLAFFSRLKMKGTVYSGFTRADFVVRLLHLSSSNFILEKQTFQVVLKDERLSVIKIQDKAPVDVQLVYNIPAQDITLDFETENWKPSRMLKLTGPFFSYNPWLNSAITSSGTVSYKLSHDTLEYKLSSEIHLINPILPPGIVVSALLHGNSEIAYFKPLVIHSNLGTIDFTGNILFKNFFPEGFLRLANVKALQDKRISADFTLDRNEESINLKGSRLLIGSSGFDTFNLDIYPRLSRLFFDLSASFDKSAYNDLISATGELIINPAFAINVDGTLAKIPISNIYKLFIKDSVYSPRIFNFLQQLTLDSGFHISSDFEATTVATDSFAVSDQLNKSNYIDLSIRGTEKEIAIDSIQAQWEKFDLSGSITSRYRSPGLISFDSKLYLEGIPYGFSGYYEEGKQLSVKGNYGLNISVLFHKKKDVIITANTLKLPFPLSGEKEIIAYTSFYMTGLFSSDGEWQITSPSTIIYNFPLLQVKENECEIAYVLNNEELFCSDIQYKDFLSELSGDGEIRFGEDVNSALTSSLVLTGRNTKEYYSLSTTLFQDRINANLVFYNSPLERIGKFIVNGSLSGDMMASGLLHQPDLQGTVSLVKGNLVGGDHVGFSTDFNIEEPVITFDALSMTYLNLEIVNGKGSFNKENGIFTFSSIFKGDYFRKNIYSSLNFSGEVINMGPEEPFYNVFKKEYTARFDISEIKVDNKKFNPWTVNLTKKADKLNIDGGPGNVLIGTFLNNGEFNIEITEPFPIRGVVKGTVVGNTIDSEVERIWLDLKVFNLILGEDIIRFTQGFASGKHIKVKGYFNDPDFEGSLLAEDVKLSFFLSPYETEPFQTTLTLHEKEFEMEKTSTRVGDGILYADKGIFYFDHWLPGAYDLSFRSDPDIGIYCSYDFDVVKVKGFAIGTVNTRADKNAVWVDGTLIAHYCTITMSNASNSDKKPSSGNTDLKINLAFETGRKVEFDWPSTNFPVLKCYAEKGSNILISYDSDLETFNMTGEAEIKGGEVFYFNRNFYLKSGKIVFNVVTPDVFDPTVSVRAEIRETDNNELVKIYLIAENNRLSEFSPRFESIPLMTEYDIFRLLGKSLEERFQQDQDLGLSFVLLSSEVLTEALIFRNIEQTIRDVFNLDLFSIRTHIIENILIDKVLGEVGDPAQSNPNSLGSYLDNTTITIGQYIGDDLFVSGLVRLTEVDYYTPESLFGSGFFGIEPELEFSLEWPTPFFNLEWTFNPTQEHLNNMFFYLTDNTIKFEWSFDY
ncbi:MAG: translocation/assembly module TamB domain-containing protein [Spirochaetales bacterium]|nr:translocation/assembly module TamB domain-containing protein [Spirochaetales bacterium]